MSEIISDPLDPARKRRGLLSIQNALLLIAMIAVWTSWYIKRQDVKRLEARIALIQPLARELIVNDPNQFAVVGLEPKWFGDAEWDLYVPAGQFEVCVATREIKGDDDLPKAAQRVLIAPGRHRLRLDQTKTDTGWRVTLTSDGKEIIGIDEPKEWDPDGGSSGGGLVSTSEELPANSPLKLFHRRFIEKMKPGAAGRLQETLPEGIVLWVEPAKK